MAYNFKATGPETPCIQPWSGIEILKTARSSNAESKSWRPKI